MPYASLQEAWGVNNNQCRGDDNKINNNFVVPNPNKSQTNLDNFFDRFYKDTNQIMNNYQEEAPNRGKILNSSLEVSNPKKSIYRKRQRWCKPRYSEKYFLDDDLSTITDPEMDVESEDSEVSRGSDIMRKMIGRRIHVKKNLNINKEEKETKKENVKEHFANLNNCEGILEHLNHCELCRAQVEIMNKNTFIKEFIIFATSGILMFIFLELIYKIAKRQ